MRYHVLKSLGRMLGARWLFQTGGIGWGDEHQWNPLTDTRVTNSTGFPVAPWVLTNAIVGFGYREAVIEMRSCIQLFRTYGAHRSWSVPAPSRDMNPSS